MITETALINIAVVVFFASGCLLSYGIILKRTASNSKSKQRFNVHNSPNKLTPNESERMSTNLFNVNVNNTIQIQAVGIKHIDGLSYDQVIKAIGNHPLSKGSVLSDELGLPIASTVENCDELAATSVLFSECESRLKRDFKFSNLSSIEFVDKQNHSLSIFPITINNQCVYFAGLAGGRINYDELVSGLNENHALK